MGCLLDWFCKRFLDSRGWQLSLVITAVLPLLFVTVYGITTSAIRRDESRAKEELETSTIAEQALNSIKTIKSLNGEDFECRRYESALEKTLRNLRSLHLCYAVSFGAMYIVQFCMYSLTCFYSSKLMIDEVLRLSITRQKFRTVRTTSLPK